MSKLPKQTQTGRDLRIVAAIKSGVDPQIVMESYDVTRDRVRAIVQQYDSRIAREARLIAAIKAGVPLYVARTRFKMPPEKIREICAKHGVEMPTTSRSRWFG